MQIFIQKKNLNCGLKIKNINLKFQYKEIDIYLKKSALKLNSQQNFKKIYLFHYKTINALKYCVIYNSF